VYKISAFVIFNKQIEKKISDQKKIVRKKFGDQIYLNHPVHLTLFTIKIKKIKMLKNIYENLNKKISKKKIKIHINHTGVFFNDPLTKGHTLYYGLKNNFLLNRVQIKHLNKINKEIIVSKKDFNYFKNSKLNNNFKKYGFAFAGKIWIPHITVASIKSIKKNDLFIKNFLKLKINYKFFADSIEFYRVSDDNHFFLFKTNII